MTFKPYHQGQTLLLPPSYAEALGEAHDAIILREIIDGLDTRALTESYANAHGGRAAYHPVMLLSVLVYAYMNGVFSSRAIAQRCRQDLAFMYLAGNTAPDFRTLARFRKERAVPVERLFVAVVEHAEAIGLVSFGTCSLDGTTLYANASKEKTTTRSALEATIRQCIADADALDAADDARYGDDEDDRDPDLRTKAGRARRRAALDDKRQAAETRLRRVAAAPAADPTARVNTTDPDARFMRMKRGGFAPGYNAQAVVENGIILSSRVCTNAADQPTLIPTITALHAQHKKMPRFLLADKGYSTEDNYTFCDQEGIDAYIPVYAEQVALDDYTYNTKNDTYTDRSGRVFRFKQCQKKRSGIASQRGERAQRYRMLVYEHGDPDTKKKAYLSIQPVWQHHVAAQKKKFATAEGRQRYRQRLPEAEGVFARIKTRFRFTTFSLRGLAGATAEWTLVTLAHNLRKLMTATI